MHNEQFRYLPPLPNIIKMIKSNVRWAGHAASKFVGGKPQGNEPLRINRWEGNIVDPMPSNSCVNRR
jgi:hypothetical protein